jgi:glycosyltransferase involved in cell wall biosynthesis
LKVSVLLATYRRAELLHKTLAAMLRLDVSGLEWELVIVDNAGDPTTQVTCESFARHLPINYLVHTRPGKNAALNYGIAAVSGDLVVLTDDDVMPDGGWIQAFIRGASRWSEHVLFGGRILPEWPQEPPAFQFDPAFGRWTYGICDPESAEGPCSTFLPMGANMAVRRQMFENGLSFDERIGPNGNSYAMGSETEFVLRLQRLGHYAVFLPGALVRHVIQPGQLDRNWLISRAFRQGRGEARLRGDISWYEIARLAKHAVWWHLAPADALKKDIASSLRRGRLFEALRMKLRLR